MAPNEVIGRSVLLRLTVGLGATAWLFSGSIGSGQSLDPHKPAPLDSGINKGYIENYSGPHYYYFWAKPGRVHIELMFEETGVFGKLVPQKLDFDFSNDESHKIILHESIKSWTSQKRIITDEHFASRQKILLTITAQKELVPLGGYYEVDITGDADLGASAGATASASQAAAPEKQQDVAPQAAAPEKQQAVAPQAAAPEKQQAVAPQAAAPEKQQDVAPQAAAPEKRQAEAAALATGHVIRDPDGSLLPAPGYDWVDPNKLGDFQVRWMPGWSLGPQWPHVVASAEEGKWKPESGYEFLRDGDYSVRPIPPPPPTDFLIYGRPGG
jgi:hypothetical protein